MIKLLLFIWYFKGYIVCVHIYDIKLVLSYNNWGISADKAKSFNIIYKGSELLIEEFPSTKVFIDTKDKFEKI